MKNLTQCGALFASVFVLVACGSAPATMDPAIGDNQAAVSAVGELTDGEVMFAGDILFSPGGGHHLRMGGEGDLVIFNAFNQPIWGTGTAGHPGAYAVLQTDGNFVVYGPAGHALWNTGTFGHGGDVLRMQNDGNLVIYGPAGHVLWASGT
jgi:hypothetical protein